MGFQDMPRIVRQAAGRKGGSVRKRKGLAALPPEKVKEITSMGGKARHANRSSKGAKQTQGGGGGSPSVLEAVLGDIDE